MLEQVGLNESQVAEIVRGQFPDLRPVSVVYLGEGYDSTAFDINHEWVFRFPKREDVEEQLLLELRVMPVLAARSPIPLPAFRFHGQPSPAFPRHFAGYAKLPGVPAITRALPAAALSRWAPALGEFLSWLHAFPVNEAAKLGVERHDVGELIDEMRTDALDDLEHVARVRPDAPLERWRAYFVRGPRASASASAGGVLVHRDLAAEHVLCDATALTITGIIDWSEIAIDDPAVDLAGLIHWGGRPFLDEVLSNYDAVVDETTLDRARYLAACRAVADVTFGLESGRREYIDQGFRALGFAFA